MVASPGHHDSTNLRRRTVAALLCLCAFQFPCVRAAIVLRDVTEETGIAFVHTDGNCGKRYIVETVSAGVALFDYDRDGDIDIYFLNGAPLRGATAGVAPKNALYRNDGRWKFTDVTDEAGVGDTGYGLGVAAGDYDNDGDLDLYLNNYGPNVLYRNNGDGTFTDVTNEAGVADGDYVAPASASWISTRTAIWISTSRATSISRTRTTRSAVSTAIPATSVRSNYDPTPDALYRNNGDGTFADVSVASGVAAHKGTGMGMVCADFDNDGDTDIIVGNDVAGNFVFQNDGTGEFEEIGLFSGLAYDLSGNAQGTMGVECGDYNNDGLLDFHATSYQRDLATLYPQPRRRRLDDVRKSPALAMARCPT